jgi:hypothetical protein
MELIWILKTASQQEADEIVELLNTRKELSATMEFKVCRVQVAKTRTADVVPDTGGDFALLGLLPDTDQMKMQVLYQR